MKHGFFASLEEEPHVVNVMEFGELEDGSPYYVMPYLRQSLSDLLGKDVFDVAAVEELPEPERPRSIPLEQALTYLEQILMGLSVAHKQGLVHRDIKPSNIMLTDKNEIRLADFGIAKAPDGVHSTVSSLGMGSRNYMAPEQRQSAKHVDASADIYAIGCVTYRMITGRLPEGRFSDPNVSVPELHQSLNDLIVGCLSQDKANRVVDARLLLNRFREAKEQQGEIADSTGTWVADGGPSLRDELKPLRDRIEKLLLDQGEIISSDRGNLNALARIVDLDTEGLDALILSVEESLHQQVRPIQNFLALIDEQVAAGDINPEALTMAGEAIGWDQAKVDSVISERLPKNVLKFSQGTFYYESGDRYEGNYKDGKRSGQGTSYCGSGEYKGDRYEGNHKDGKFSGQGIYYWEDGDRYEGNFKDAKPSGQGTYYSKDGSQEKQNWRDGKNVW
jgi:eukaryotic-like serine/threonine-protein kinase